MDKESVIWKNAFEDKFPKCTQDLQTKCGQNDRNHHKVKDPIANLLEAQVDARRVLNTGLKEAILFVHPISALEKVKHGQITYMWKAVVHRESRREC